MEIEESRHLEATERKSGDDDAAEAHRIAGAAMDGQKHFDLLELNICFGLERASGSPGHLTDVDARWYRGANDPVITK